jgi:hypothetical protein
MRLSAVVVLVVATCSCNQPGPSEAPSDAPPSPVREWSAATGAFKVTAELVRREPNAVILRRSDGEEVKILIDRLSAADQEFLKATKSPTQDVATAPPVDVKGAESFLVVSARTASGHTMILTGLVFSADEKLAYVVVNLPPVTYVGDNPLLHSDFHAVVGDDDNPRRVALQKISWNSRDFKLVLAAPQGELPPVALPKQNRLPAENEPLRFISFEIREQPGPAFSRIAVHWQVDRILTTETGEKSGFIVNIPEPIPAADGVLLARDGTLYPVKREGSLSPLAPDPSKISTFSTVSTAQFAELLRPDCLNVRTRVTVKPQDVEVHVQVQTFEPDTAARPPKLLFATQPPKKAFLERPRIELENGRWKNRTGDGYVIDLKPAVAADPSLSGALDPAQWPRGRVWTGTLTLPPETDSWHFVCLAARADAGGLLEPIGQPMENSFYVSSDELEKAWENYKPPQQTDGSGNKYLTSPKTLVSDQPVTQIENKPQPEPVGATCLASVRDFPSFSLGQLKLPEKAYPSEVVASADGRRLYVLDGASTLHKIDTTTWTVERKIKLPWEARHLALSSAGVLAQVGIHQTIWIMDPETLEVKFEVESPKPFAESITASPHSPLAFAAGVNFLIVIDVAAGKIAHTIEGGYFRAVIAPHGSPRLTATRDGKYLYMHFNGLSRFRIDQQDLILEEQGQPKLNRPIDPSGISSDGTAIAYTENTKTYVLNGKKLAEPVKAHAANCFHLAWSPQGDRMVCVGDRGVLGYQFDGTPQFKESSLRSYQEIVTFGDGERYALLGKEMVGILDLKKGRFPAAAKP